MSELHYNMVCNHFKHGPNNVIGCYHGFDQNHMETESERGMGLAAREQPGGLAQEPRDAQSQRAGPGQSGTQVKGSLYKTP